MQADFIDLVCSRLQMVVREFLRKASFRREVDDNIICVEGAVSTRKQDRTPGRRNNLCGSRRGRRSENSLPPLEAAQFAQARSQRMWRIWPARTVPIEGSPKSSAP